MANRKTKQHTITIVKAQFDTSENLSYLDLFEGYDEIYAVNYVHNLDFLIDLLPRFKKAEYILGNPGLITATLENTCAMQIEALQNIYKNERLEEIEKRTAEGSLNLYLADAPLYLEKVFCLKNSKGDVRVIIGSGNMNQQAANSDRNAQVVCFDGEKAYNYYMSCFEQFKQQYAVKIAQEALTPTHDDMKLLENMPIWQKAAQDEDHIYPADSRTAVSSLEVYAGDIKRAANYFVDLPKADRKGQAKITRDKVDIIKQKTLDNIQVRRAKFEKFMPQLVIEPETGRAFYNEREYDLRPGRSDIKQDAETYLSYMAGFDSAVPQQNVKSMKEEYFKLMAWCFLSPFLARIRTTIREATVTDEVFTYPIVALLCGQSNAGKTIYVSLLMKMMTDSALYKAFGQNNFTKTRVDSLLSSIKGLPILIDDITQSQFTNNSGNIIKQEERIIREDKPENLNYYPAILLTANKELNSLKNELTKRMIVFHVNASWNNEVTRQSKSPCSQLIQKMRGALYSEYLRRMMPHINRYLSEMNDLGASSLDLYRISSEVLIEIFQDNGAEIPSYMRVMTMKDYFDSKAVNDIMIKYFQHQYKLNRNFFEVLKKNNQLVFEDKSASSVGKITPMKIVESLPPELEADVVGDKIIMRLDTANKFFGIEFKEQGLLDKLFGR